MMCPVCDVIGAQYLVEDENLIIEDVRIRGAFLTRCNACGGEYYNEEQVLRTERLIKEQTNRG